MSHTPGRWFQNLSDKLQILADDPRKTIICRVSGSVSNPSAMADALLISAAPDLLEACIAAVQVVDGKHPQSWVAIDQLRSAIKKASVLGRSTPPPPPPPPPGRRVVEGIVPPVPDAPSFATVELPTGYEFEALDQKPLADAVLGYDAAIRSCANDPKRMSSFCTAEGDDLDTLYLRMVNMARAVKDQS